MAPSIFRSRFESFQSPPTCLVVIV